MECTLEIQQQLLSDHNSLVFILCQCRTLVSSCNMSLKIVLECVLWQKASSKALRQIAWAFHKSVLFYCLFWVRFCFYFEIIVTSLPRIFMIYWEYCSHHVCCFRNMSQRSDVSKVSLSSQVLDLVFQADPSAINYSRSIYPDTVISPLVCREANAAGSPRWCYRDPWRCCCHWTHHRRGCYCFHGSSAAAEDPHWDR